MTTQKDDTDHTMITAQDAAQLLNISSARVAWLCRNGVFKTAVRGWLLSRSEIDPATDYAPTTRTLEVPAEKLVDTAQAAIMLGTSVQNVSLYCRKGRFASARKLARDWVIEREEIEQAVKDRRIPSHGHTVGYVGVTEIAKRLGWSKMTVHRWFSKGRFKTARINGAGTKEITRQELDDMKKSR